MVKKDYFPAVAVGCVAIIALVALIVLQVLDPVRIGAQSNLFGEAGYEPGGDLEEYAPPIHPETGEVILTTNSDTPINDDTDEPKECIDRNDQMCSTVQINGAELGTGSCPQWARNDQTCYRCPQGTYVNTKEGACTQKKPGVGFVVDEGTQTCWQGFDWTEHFTINLSARPWGPDGNGLLRSDEWLARYRAGAPQLGWVCGNTAELYFVNEITLTNMFNEGLLGDPAEYTGEPTEEEQYDFAATTPRNSNLYRDYWYNYGITEDTPGRSPQVPMKSGVADSEGNWRYYMLDGLYNTMFYREWTQWTPGNPCYEPGYPEVLGTCE